MVAYVFKTRYQEGYDIGFSKSTNMSVDRLNSLTKCVNSKQLLLKETGSKQETIVIKSADVSLCYAQIFNGK